MWNFLEHINILINPQTWQVVKTKEVIPAERAASNMFRALTDGQKNWYSDYVRYKSNENQKDEVGYVKELNSPILKVKQID